MNNTLTEAIAVDLGDDRKASFLFTITRPDGVKLEIPPLMKEGLSRGGKITLGPGQSYGQRLLLNEWSDFGFLGQYSIEVRMAGQVKTQRERVVRSDKGYRTIIEIKPRDVEKLNAVCQGLLQEVLSTQSYGQVIEPAVALSYIDDPVAVPYLEKLLRANRMLDGVALLGLARIGDNQAIQVLLSALNMRNKETAITASQRLQQIKGSIKDPNLKAKVEQALSSFAGSDKRR